MTRFLLLTAILFTGLPSAQSQTKEIVKEVNEKLDSLRNEDDQLRAILSNHPSVAAAKAKVLLAQAELDQIRLELTTKITAARAEVKLAEQGYEHVRDLMKQMQAARQSGTVSSNELLQMQLQATRLETNVQQGKSKLQELTLSEAHSKWWMEKNSGQPLTASIRFNDSNPSNRSGSASAVSTINPTLATAVGKSIKMEANGLAPDLMNEVLKKAGFIGMVRPGPIAKDKNWKDAILTVKHSGELSVSGWVDLILDDVNSRIGNTEGPYECYVREYGLLIAERKLAPSDAMTLRDFARAVRSEKK